MAEHAELVAELPLVEKMTTAERLKHAKKRRSTQLKKFSHYEKQIDKENKRKKSRAGTDKSLPVAKKAKKGNVRFVNNIMLLEAAARNDVDEVDRLLGGGVSPDVTNEDGLTALHQCCIDDQETLLRILLKYSANVNAQDSELWTPLHAAATCGHVHLCRLLVDHGAELLAVNADGNMPYDICEDDLTLDYIESEMAKRGVTQELIDETRLSSERKMLEDMIVLAERGGDLNFHGRAGETPLHTAAANGYLQVAEFLLDQRVIIDATDDDTWQPIHAAACWGHLHILELLVQHGADLEARTKSNESPLEICEDAEVRTRIMEMRDEIQSNQSTKSRDLKRRRSQNSRSASIRRTSMREKTPMALKEAKEEALRLRNSTTSTDDEYEVDEDGKENRPDKSSDRLPVRHLSDMAEEDENSPTTLETIHLQDKDPNDALTENTSHNTPPPPIHPAAPPGNNKPAEHRKQTNPAERTADPPTEPINNKPPSNGVSRTTNSVPLADKSPAPAMIFMEATSERHRAPSSTSTESAVSGKAASSQGSQQGSEITSPASNTNSLLGDVGQGQRGTLADLKKQRALKVNDNTKPRDSSSLSSQFDEYSNSHSDSENNIVTSAPNGQNTGHNGLHKNNMYYVSGDKPKHKFTASKAEIIGGNDSKTSCCTIL